MNLDKKVFIIILTCLLLVISSIIPFRWLLLNDDELKQGKMLVDRGLGELRILKKNVDTFYTISISLDNNQRLKKSYYDKRMTYHNEFGREGVESIDNVLKTLYMRDAFFELEKFTIKHQLMTIKEKSPDIQFLVDGNKRLVKND